MRVMARTAKTQQNAMLSVVDDWHAYHKYNVREIRKEVEAAAD